MVYDSGKEYDIVNRFLGENSLFCISMFGEISKLCEDFKSGEEGGR